MKNPIEKLENPNRIKALDIVGSLIRAGIKETDVICDYGAGTGIFTIEAAKLSRQRVYALDMSQQMIDFLEQKCIAQGILNVQVKKVEADCIDLPKQSIDLFILVTVLHEINDIPSFIKAIKTVLKPEGRVMVIDFKKVVSSFGPSIEDRISAYQAARHFLREGIELEKQFDLSEHFYQLVMKNT